MRYSGTSEAVVKRGNNYNWTNPAGNRNDNTTSNSNDNWGFRATLILFSMYKVYGLLPIKY